MHMHAPFVHMFDGVSLLACMIYTCMLVACVQQYKMFSHTETYSLFHCSSSTKQDISKHQKMSNITAEKKDSYQILTIPLPSIVRSPII